MNTIDNISDKELSLAEHNKEFSHAEELNKILNINHQFNTHLNELKRVNMNSGDYNNKTGSGTHIISDFTNQIIIPEDITNQEISSEEEEKIPSYKQALNIKKKRDTKLIGKFSDALNKEPLLCEEQKEILINFIDKKSKAVPDYFTIAFISSLSDDHNISNFILELFTELHIRISIFYKKDGDKEAIFKGIRRAAKLSLN